MELCNYVDVYYNDRITPDLEFMSATATKAQIERFELRKGDVLITKDSESWFDIAVPAVVEADLDRVLCGYHLALIRPRPECDGRFLARVFSAIGPRDQYWVSANGITRFALGFDAISTGLFALPPIEEQRAIAAFLDREAARIDALVGKQQRLIALLIERRKTLITLAVTRGLRRDVAMINSGFNWLGKIPANWRVKQLRYCCRITSGQVSPDDERFLDRTLIAPNHIESGTGRILCEETAREQQAISGKYLVDPGDLIYSKIRPALNKACIAHGEWLCSADMYPVKVVEKGLSSKFLLFFILSEPFVKLMIDESMRVAMPKVNRERLKSCPLVLPPRDEQEQIVEFLEIQTRTIDELILKARSVVERLLESRLTLISAAVTGKIDVRQEPS